METVQGNGSSVLIVDDDPFFHVVLSQMLGVLGITDIHSAHDGRQALRMLQSVARPGDFLICDVYMPELDGLEFMNALSSRQYPGRILLVSGLDPTMLDLSRLIATQNGLRVAGAFVKPLALEQLALAMEIPFHHDADAAGA